MLKALLFATAVLGTQVELHNEAASATELEKHYEVLSAQVSKNARLLQSANLAEIDTHLAVKNPMEKIYDICQQMRNDIAAEKKVVMKKNGVRSKMCTTTQFRYRAGIEKNNNIAKSERDAALVHEKKHKARQDEPAAKEKERAGRNVTIALDEKTVRDEQAARDKSHRKFLVLQDAFSMALGNVSLIRRVLNGEGSLGDLHGGGNARLIEMPTCSSQMSLLAQNVDSVPEVSSMLQVFSKSFEKLEGAHNAPGDMDAINTILDKVRENLEKSLKIATAQENAAIVLWKSRKQKITNKINDDYIANWKNYKEQGAIELDIGVNWEAQGKHLVAKSKAIKRRDELTILNQFLKTRCHEDSIAYKTTLTTFANEKNALDSILNYLNNNVLKKWRMNGISDVASSPYEWKLEKAPTYVAVKNTYSTTNHNNGDNIQCRSAYATVFDKIRILTQVRTNQAFIDPNDMTFSTNKNVKRTTNLKDVQCQLFPTGIPLGRAHSCSDKQYSNAKIDLTGTIYKFDSHALKMFKVLGRKTAGSEAKLSKDGKILTLQVRGRCGDLYGDDAQLENVDYRSDPIPLEKA